MPWNDIENTGRYICSEQLGEYVWRQISYLRHPKEGTGSFADHCLVYSDVYIIATKIWEFWLNLLLRKDLILLGSAFERE